MKIVLVTFTLNARPLLEDKKTPKQTNKQQQKKKTNRVSHFEVSFLWEGMF